MPFTSPRSASVEVGLKQMGVMLRSGLTLLETLRAVGEQTTSRPLRKVLGEIAADVRSGKSLTHAFKVRGYFSRIVTQLCEVGEQTGQLDLVLERAAEALERRRLLKAQIIAALLYPGIVFLASVAVTIFILTYAIPRISVYLKALGRPLPPMTQRLVDLSDFLVTQWPMIVGSVLLAGVLFGVTYTVPVGRLLIDSIVLRIPLIGYILRTGATAAFSRSMSILLSSGVTIIESLRTCQDLHKNRRLAMTIARAREEVIGGDSLAPSFRSDSFANTAFMPMLASMIAAGEKSGQLDQTLVECATFHEQRLASLIRVLSSVIEIAVVVFVGGIVGYVYLAFMVALYGAAL
jgi:type IV pilus assembly protein PilC